MMKLSNLDKITEMRQPWNISVNLLPTISDKIFGSKWNNPVKLERRRKVWYLYLRVF